MAQARTIALAGLAAALAAAALGWATHLALRGPGPHLLVAPMIGLDPCIVPDIETVAWDRELQREVAAACLGPQGSAARVVESTLAALQPGGPVRGLELGYTLNVPLLKLFRPEGDTWVLDEEVLGRLVRTIRDQPRPLVLYLFSTHFGQKARIEPALAADPRNLSWTVRGPLPVDRYYSLEIYNWTFTGTDNEITRRRVQAANAVLRAVCELGPEHARKVRGVTLLGELHHLFPDFQAGMGYAPPYLITDYSEASRAGFRQYLRERFGSVRSMNRSLGSAWPSFDAVEPPSRDVRREPLRDFTEHIDPYAHGIIPVTGWAFVPGATLERPATVRIYRNGDLVGLAPVALHRQDVLAANPEFGDATVGWRFDIDFRGLRTGWHRIDVMLDRGDALPVLLATRRVAILDRRHETPLPLPARELPPHVKADERIRAWVDVPLGETSYFHNPMAALWHAFRAQQVVRYLQAFNRALEAPCLAHAPRYTHQIVPFTNPGWDGTKFAIEASLGKLDGLELGTSLYGEPVYGPSFLRWLGGSGHPRYGITEYHPLKAMDPAATRAVFAQHALHGATFLSFFMEPRWNGRRISGGANLFSLDPDNPQFGSAELYRSMQAVLGSAGAPRLPAPGPRPATAAP